MEECFDTESIVSLYPTELLLNIFQHLSGRQLYSCRRVCSQWMHIINEYDDKFWLRKCREDHHNVYKDARTKSSPLSWFDLYKSLTLWTKFSAAKENWNINELKIKGPHSVHACGGGIVIHEEEKIVYHDADTLEITNVVPIGRYTHLEENEHFIAYIPRENDKLLVISKVGRPCVESSLQVAEDVYDFIMFYNCLYYVAKSNDLDLGLYKYDIFMCKLEGDFETIFIKTVSGYHRSFQKIGCKLYFAMSINLKMQLFEVVNDKFVLIGYVKDEQLLNFWNRNDFVDLKFNIIFAGTQTFGIDMHFSNNILLMYGHRLIVGSRQGLLSVYDFSSMDFENPTPIKVFDLNMILGVRRARITSVDVMEICNGHKLIVCTMGKLLVLELSHPGPIDYLNP